VDTGHSIRSQEKPHDVIRALGARVHSLHLKDWRFGGPETILGEGDMDMVAVAAALKAIGFNGPIMMEYEESPSEPTADMQKGLANWRAACAKA
jgi:sugar phosphate isomerase/epimerase